MAPLSQASEQCAVEALLCPPFPPYQQRPDTPTLFVKALASYQQGPSTLTLFALLDILMLQGAHAWVCIAIHTVLHHKVVALSRVDCANLESMHADAELLMLRQGQQPPESSLLSDGSFLSQRSIDARPDSALWSAAYRETDWQSHAARPSTRSPPRASTPSRTCSGGLSMAQARGKGTLLAVGSNGWPLAHIAPGDSAPQVPAAHARAHGAAMGWSGCCP